jgi:hypothetical protein
MPTNAKKSLKKWSVVLVILTAVVACVVVMHYGREYLFGTKTGKQGEHFAIYLVSDLRHMSNVEKAPVARLKLDAEPILSDDDITEYEWNTHMMKLSPGSRVRVEERLAGKAVVPFVVVANAKRCYRGTFLSHISSYMPSHGPIIWYGIRLPPPEDIIKISPTVSAGAEDLRNDARIRKALEELGVLK